MDTSCFIILHEWFGFNPTLICAMQQCCMVALLEYYDTELWNSNNVLGVASALEKGCIFFY